MCVCVRMLHHFQHVLKSPQFHGASTEMRAGMNECVGCTPAGVLHSRNARCTQMITLPLRTGPCIFKDSASFMNDSLARLAENLPRSGKIHLHRWVRDVIAASRESRRRFAFDVEDCHQSPVSIRHNLIKWGGHAHRQYPPCIIPYIYLCVRASSHDAMTRSR